ncbi:MAG: BON domain-containing protein [Chloroflexi bacterium]|nr:BON domain-containing protein [Chloroflexota bacterium]
MEPCQIPPEAGVGAGDSSSGGGIPLPPENDEQVTQAVRQAFFLDPILSVDSFEITTANRVVYLRGMVPTPDLKERAEQVAAQVQGVNRVVNQVRVVTP